MSKVSDCRAGWSRARFVPSNCFHLVILVMVMMTMMVMIRMMTMVMVMMMTMMLF